MTKTTKTLPPLKWNLLADSVDIENRDAHVLRLFVVRHGQTDCNKKKILQGHLNTYLNAEGTQQARLCGERFRSVNIDGFASSDLYRCIDTLAEIKQHHDNVGAVHVSPSFRERTFGPVEGLTITEAVEYASAHSTKDESKTYKDFGEDREVFRKRLFSAVDGLVADIIKKEAGEPGAGLKNVLLVTHGGSIRTLLDHFANELRLDINEKLIDQGHATRVVYNTSVTIFDFFKPDVIATGGIGRGVIQIIGDTRHLGEQLEVKDQRIR